MPLERLYSVEGSNEKVRYRCSDPTNFQVNGQIKPGPTVSFVDTTRQVGALLWHVLVRHALVDNDVTLRKRSHRCLCMYL